MKILFISYEYLSPFDNITGFIHDQVRELKRQGCEVKVICPVIWTPFPLKYISKKWRKYSETPPKIYWDNVEVHYPHYLAFPRGMFLASAGSRMYMAIRKIVKRIYKNFKFDIIHAHTVIPAGEAAEKVAKDYKKPLVVTTHGSDLRTFYKNKKVIKKIFRILKFAKFVISPHPELTDLLRGLNLNNIREISNSVNLEKFNPKNSQSKSKMIKKEFNIKNEKMVSFIANLKPFKDPETFIRAIPLILKNKKDIIFFVVGDGELKNNLQKLSSKMHITKDVIFTGRRADVDSIMATSDLFVALSPFENIWSTVVLEAMASGVPCIVTKSGHTAKYLKHRFDSYLIKKKSPKDLAKAVLELLNNEELSREISKNAQAMVRKNFDNRKNAKKIKKLYSEILKC